MPSASPAGTQPFMISLAKSCPDRSEVNGRFRREPRCRQVDTGPTPGARMAVPIALNSRPPAGNAPMVSRLSRNVFFRGRSDVVDTRSSAVTS